MADAALEVARRGCGTLMGKVDVKTAYRNIPIHPDDWWLLGIRWEGGLFVDTTLPFGLRLAPKIFTAVADAVEWILKAEGVDFVIHCLDDFFVVGAPNSDECEANLLKVLEVFARLGLPVAVQIGGAGGLLNLPRFRAGFDGYGASSPRPEASRASRADFGVAREAFLPAVGIGVVSGQTGSRVHSGAAGENVPPPHV